MTIMDHKLIMADSDTLASVSISTATVIGDVLDLGARKDAFGNAANPNIGEGAPIGFKCICEDEAFTSGGSPSITVSLVTAADESISSGVVTLLTKTGIVKASGTDGATLLTGVLPQGTIKRYLATRVTTDVALTAGKITSWLQDAPIPTEVAYK